jgi:MFS family permease
MIDALTTDRSGRVSAQWRTFRAYWLGLTVSTIGDSFTLVALPIAAYTINRSSVLVGFVDMMEILSGVLLGSFLGIVADRSDSRTVMFWSDATRATMLLALSVMAYSDSWNEWTILALAFCLGALRAFHDGAESSMLATIIPPSREMQAFARISSAESISRLIGPFIGGITLEVGLWVAFGVDAMTFVVASIIVLTLPRQRQPASEVHRDDRRSMRAEFAEAVAAMRARPTYLALVGVGAFGNLAGLTMAGLFVPFATDILRLRSVGLGFGLLLAVAGLGGLAANWVANRQASHDPRTAGLSMAVVAAFVLIAGALPSIITSVLAMFAMGGGIAFYQSNYAAYRQEVFAPELLGRVSMVTRTIFYLTMTVGFATGGFIADGLGPDRLFIIFGAIALAGVMAVGFIPLEIDPETGQTI